MKNYWKNFIVIALIAAFLLGVTGCSNEYEESKKYIVDVIVLRTEKDSHWTGKFYTYDYNVYFDIGDGNEWKVDNYELFDLLKEGDVISVFRTDYIKDEKIIKSEFDFIN